MDTTFGLPGLRRTLLWLYAGVAVSAGILAVLLALFVRSRIMRRSLATKTDTRPAGDESSTEARTQGELKSDESGPPSLDGTKGTDA